jgi:hypothetical protein
MQRDGGGKGKIGAVIMKTMGPGTDDGVLVLLNVIVLVDNVLKPLADIPKMVSLVFFLDFLFKSLYSIVFFPLFCNLDLPPLLLSSAFQAAYFSAAALATWGLDPRGQATFPFCIHE